MNFQKRIDTLNRLAAEREARRVAAQASADLVGRLHSGTTKVPLLRRGFVTSHEGFETAYSAVEPVTLSLALPATTVAWSLRDASYRVELELARPGHITVTAGDETISANRRVNTTAVLDLDRGEIVIEASEPVVNVRVERYERRTDGELILGPFRADGEVSASVIGHGDFTVEIARDYDVYRRIVPSGGALTLEPIEGVPYDYLQDGIHGFGRGRYGDNFGGRALRTPTLPWSVARLFDESLPAPVWRDTVEVGMVADRDGITDVIYDTTTPVAAGPTALPEYWQGLRQWGRLAAQEVPGFRGLEGSDSLWTYLWGRVVSDEENLILSAYDADTGSRVDISSLSEPGHYLIERQRQRSSSVALRDTPVRFDGVWCAYGEPLRTASDPLARPGRTTIQDDGGRIFVPPGRYRVVPHRVYPNRFLVRVRGSGILRALDFNVVSAARNPAATVTEQTYRENLSQYHRNHSDGRSDVGFSRPSQGALHPA